MQNHPEVTSNNSTHNPKDGRKKANHWCLPSRSYHTYRQTCHSRMEHEDQIDVILEGLADEYKFSHQSAWRHDTPLTITELHEKPHNHEAKLIAVSPTLQTPFPVTVNTFQRNWGYNNNHSTQPRYNNQSNFHDKKNNMTWQQNRHGSRTPKSYVGRC